MDLFSATGSPGTPFSLSGSTQTAPQIAAAFGEAFARGKEEFKPGDPLGTFSFAAQGQ